MLAARQNKLLTSTSLCIATRAQQHARARQNKLGSLPKHFRCCRQQARVCGGVRRGAGVRGLRVGAPEGFELVHARDQLLAVLVPVIKARHDTDNVKSIATRPVAMFVWVPHKGLLDQQPGGRFSGWLTPCTSISLRAYARGARAHTRAQCTSPPWTAARCQGAIIGRTQVFSSRSQTKAGFRRRLVCRRRGRSAIGTRWPPRGRQPGGRRFGTQPC